MLRTGIHKFRGGEIEVISEDILRVKYDSNRKIDVKDITVVKNKRIELLGKIPYYPIIDMTDGVLKFSDEAKAWVAVNNEEVSSRIMDIFLANSLVMKFKIKIYLAVFKPINKTIVVSSLEKALVVINNHKRQLQAKSSV